MNDAILSRFIDAITTQSGKTTELLESQEKVNTSLTANLDAILSTLSDERKKKSTLDSKIGKLSDSSLKTEEHLGKLNKTLGSVASVLQQTNILTAKQTKILQKMDPGGRRLLGDTYDSPTGAGHRGGTDKQLLRAIKGIKGGMGVTRGLVTAGMGFGGYKLLSFLMRNRMLLTGLGLGGAMAPEFFTGDVGFREGLLGNNSWLRKNFYGQGGYGGAAADFAMDNPWWTLGGAAAVGTRLGRSAVGAVGQRAWAVGSRAVPWAYGGAPLGGRAITAFGGRMIPTTAAMYNPAMAMTQAGQRAGGSIAQALTPQTMEQIMANRKTRRAVEKAFNKGAMAAIKSGANREMAKRAGALIAARALQGLGLALTGVGTGASVALWMYTIYQIADMFADPLYSALSAPGGWIAAWWVDSHAEKMADARDKLGDAAVAATFGGVNVQDESGRFLDKKGISGQKTFIDPSWRAMGPGAMPPPISKEGQKKNKLIADYLEAIKDPDVRIYQRQSEAKNRIIKKILHISDGKEFLNGKTWSHRELAEAPYDELWNLYWGVVLPRASSPEATTIREDTNKLLRKKGMKEWVFEGGMSVKGSRAENRTLEHAAIIDKAFAPSESIWGFGGGVRTFYDKGTVEEEEERLRQKEIKKATLLHEGLGGLISLETWVKESEANRADLTAAIHSQNAHSVAEQADALGWKNEERTFWNNQIELQQKILDKRFDPNDSRDDHVLRAPNWEGNDKTPSDALKEPAGERSGRTGNKK